jgi:hypothetical protein
MHGICDGATTFSITTTSIMTLSITTLSFKGLFATLSMRDTQYNGTLNRVPFMLSCVVLNVVMLSVVMLTVVAPL